MSTATKQGATPLKIGDRIYYTGDMANCASEGTIVAYRPASKYASESWDILFDEERFEKDEDRRANGIMACMFDPAPGRRFWLLSDWLEDKRLRIEAMKADRIAWMVKHKGYTPEAARYELESR